MPSRRAINPARAPAAAHPRTLAIILGDQLNINAQIIRELDPRHDTVLMMEVREESTHVPSHKQRTVLFLSAMRHFAAELRDKGVPVRYITLDDPANTHSFATEIARAIADLSPERLRVIEPGEHRVAALIRSAAGKLPLEILPDEHFLTPPEEFQRWAKGRAGLVMEYFYRQQRRRLNILVDDAGKPEGGDWNYDASNRLSFPKTGPSPRPPKPRRFAPDQITKDVIRAVSAILPGNPGSLDDFSWPVTRAQARQALADFVEHRLPLFGPYEDAMWTSEPWLYHAQLSPSLNLKLLDPRECIDAALDAYRRKRAPLQSVEAFIRQIIGWREFIRGVYMLEGPDYARRNFLGEHGSLPELYWTAKTDMNCLRHCVGEVLNHSYGHHIQRLMVTGNFALLAGVHPKAISDWYLGMYVDGVDWVTLPNTLGMAMHADARPGTNHGVVGTKPYAASGQYISRMSNYCTSCRYDPTKRTGADACPFTTLYWDFLHRHRARFAKNQRMTMILKNLDRFTKDTLTQITVSAARTRRDLGITSGSRP